MATTDFTRRKHRPSSKSNDNQARGNEVEENNKEMHNFKSKAWSCTYRQNYSEDMKEKGRRLPSSFNINESRILYKTCQGSNSMHIDVWLVHVRTETMGWTLTITLSHQTENRRSTKCGDRSLSEPSAHREGKEAVQKKSLPGKEQRNGEKKWWCPVRRAWRSPFTASTEEEETMVSCATSVILG